MKTLMFLLGFTVGEIFTVLLIAFMIGRKEK